MNESLTKEDYMKIPAQLRKPEGEDGYKVAEFMNTGNLPMNLHTLAAVNPEENDSILEIGMGNGHFVKNILNLYETINYTGCDYSLDMVEASVEKNKKFMENGRAKFVHGNVQQLPFHDNSFNKIFTINTFYFWDDFPKVIRELKRVLLLGGVLIISVRPKHNLVDFPVTEFGFSLFTETEIIEILSENGFRFKEVAKVKEPNREFMGEIQERENLILTFN